MKYELSGWKALIIYALVTTGLVDGTNWIFWRMI
jgi:hypothetical protein